MACAIVVSFLIWQKPSVAHGIENDGFRSVFFFVSSSAPQVAENNSESFVDRRTNAIILQIQLHRRISYGYAVINKYCNIYFFEANYPFYLSF